MNIYVYIYICMLRDIYGLALFPDARSLWTIILFLHVTHIYII